jgi:hypothetical protein
MEIFQIQDEQEPRNIRGKGREVLGGITPAYENFRDKDS